MLRNLSIRHSIPHIYLGYFRSELLTRQSSSFGKVLDKRFQNDSQLGHLIFKLSNSSFGRRLLMIHPRLRKSRLNGRK